MIDESAAAGFLQVAGSSRWDRALRIGLDGTAVTLGGETTEAQWDSAGDILAFEVFFGPAIDAAFVGVRPGTGHGAVDRVLTDLRSSEDPMTPSTVIRVLRQRVEPNLFTSPPISAAIGLVNDWQPTAIELWRHPHAVPTVPELARWSRPLLSTRATWNRPIGLELVFAGPPGHWLGIPVSEPADGGYRLDRRRLAMGLNAVELFQRDVPVAPEAL